MKNVEFVSAQNVKIDYELASTAQRVVAMFIDILALSIFCVALFYVLESFIDFEHNESFVFYGFIARIPFIIYFPLMEYFTNGQSLGKYVMGIRVVTMQGEAPGWKEIFTRWAFRGDFVWISPNVMMYLWILFSLMGIFFSYISPYNQRLGDVMARTLVIKARQAQRYVLKDVLSIRTKEDNYVPSYPRVIMFTDDDMMLIKNVLTKQSIFDKKEFESFVIDLSDKAAKLIGLDETPKNRLTFLRTLLNDYVVLTR